MKSPGAAWALSLLLAAASFNACVEIKTEPPRTIGAKSLDDQPLRRMVQTSAAGPLKIDAVVYKPKVLPLSRFFSRLARGDFKKAVAGIRLRYDPSNVDDKTLKTLIRQGFIPVLIAVANTGSERADTRDLTLRLRDADLALAPIPNEELPKEFRSLDPKAVAANVYNMTAAVVGAAVVLAVIAGLLWVSAQAGDHSPVTFDWPSSKGADNGSESAVFNPLTKETSIDYNGLLFNPRPLAPGESVRGLLFFKARGVDWTNLRLEAALRPSSP